MLLIFIPYFTIPSSHHRVIADAGIFFVSIKHFNENVITLILLKKKREVQKVKRRISKKKGQNAIKKANPA